jgi:hypothetical protein
MSLHSHHGARPGVAAEVEPGRTEGDGPGRPRGEEAGHALAARVGAAGSAAEGEGQRAAPMTIRPHSSRRSVLGCAALDIQNTHITPTSPSSRGPGHRPFTAVTRVRISVGTPTDLPDLRQFRSSCPWICRGTCGTIGAGSNCARTRSPRCSPPTAFSRFVAAARPGRERASGPWRGKPARIAVRDRRGAPRQTP